MCMSLRSPQEPVLCLGWHILYSTATEPEHRKLLWMLTRTEVKPCRAVNMIVHHISLCQSAMGRWPEMQAVDGWWDSTKCPAAVPWLCYSIQQRSTGGVSSSWLVATEITSVQPEIHVDSVSPHSAPQWWESAGSPPAQIRKIWS